MKFDSIDQNSSAKSSNSKPKPSNPTSKASIASLSTFWYFNSFAALGFTKTLTLKDLWTLKFEESSEQISNKFEENWKNESSKTQTLSIISVLLKTLGLFYISGACFRLCNDLLQNVSPQLLKVFLDYITSPTDQPLWHGFLIAFAFFMISSIQSLVQHRYDYVMFVTGARIRTALISAIYRKSMNLSNSARADVSTGEIINLMSSDVDHLVDLMPDISMLWSAPLQICMSMYFLWHELGFSVLAGLALMILMIPLNGWTSSCQQRFQDNQMQKKDERVGAINELINGIKVIKLYGWEFPFMNKITEHRNGELHQLRNIAYMRAANSIIWTCAPFAVSLVTFAVYVLSSSDHVLDAKKAFVSLWLFEMMRFPMTIIPEMVSKVMMASVSVKRLNRFLNSEQLEKYVERKNLNENAIEVENGTFSWNKNETEKPILCGIDLKIKKGQLVAIVGNVGSGKSSLLSAILGDMELIHGNVHLDQSESISYVSQQAWIQNATLRDNILFGSEYDKVKYDHILEKCALLPDLSILPGGDQTEIGEKGINLSGGQKQRVAIARACYSNTSLTLLDDPLSAVDSHVAQHIFRKVLNSQTGFLKNRTRILVTNNITFLPEVDQIIVLENGKISESGSYQQLMENSNKFSQFIKEHFNDKGSESQTEKVIHEIKDETNNQTTQINEDQSQLIESEQTESGHVKLSIYQQYFHSMTYHWSALMLLGYVLVEVSMVATNLWLAAWSNDHQQTSGNNQNNYRLGVYALLGLAQASFYFFGSVAQAKGNIHSSRQLHQRLLQAIVRSPMQFFETTPTGRVMNRFSADIESIDCSLPGIVESVIYFFNQVMSTLILISIEIPAFIFVIFPVLWMYSFVQKFYLSTSRQLNRLESVTRSPILSHFGESLSGVTTIRAYQRITRFISESNHRVDTNQRCNYPIIVANRWLAMRLEFCGNLIVFAVTMFAVLSRDTFRDQPGMLSLIIIYAMRITWSLNWCIQNGSEMEGNVVAVERIEQYCRNETEREWEQEVNENQMIPEDWPQNGEIEFVQYSMRYRSGLDLVLDSIDFKIKGGEKIGIVGRTGAGKSSLTLALFRIVEGASGKIVIDGLDIGQIGMHQLRHKLAIIPQDPVLFSGTIRSNLDPFGVYRDELLHSALEQCHLSQFISSQDSGLDYSVSENGSNLSLGQRQLICLARALLRRSQILVLDEATASIDLQTDSFIQQTIRTQFAHCTVLTIAHRLNTILDSDRVLVLDQGKVAEFDTPTRLLADHSSRFYSLAKDAKIV